VKSTVFAREMIRDSVLLEQRVHSQASKVVAVHEDLFAASSSVVSSAADLDPTSASKSPQDNLPICSDSEAFPHLFVPASAGRLNLHPSLCRAICKIIPDNSPLTLVQQATLPPACAGRNVSVRAQTGSGKTLSYAVPVVHRIAQYSASRRQALGGDRGTLTRKDGPFAVVLVPTRELAAQVAGIFETLTRTMPWVVTKTVTGGDGRGSEKKAFSQGVGVVVATPGRFLDHLKNTAALSTPGAFRNLLALVLDECDRLVDMNLAPVIREIVQRIDGTHSSSGVTGQMRNGRPVSKGKGKGKPSIWATPDDATDDVAASPAETPATVSRPTPRSSASASGPTVRRQNLLLSATTSATLSELAQELLANPVHVSVSGEDTFALPASLDQRLLVCPTKMRLAALATLLGQAGTEAAQETATAAAAESAGEAPAPCIPKRVLVFAQTAAAVEFLHSVFSAIATADLATGAQYAGGALEPAEGTSDRAALSLFSSAAAVAVLPAPRAVTAGTATDDVDPEFAAAADSDCDMDAAPVPAADSTAIINPSLSLFPPGTSSSPSHATPADLEVAAAAPSVPVNANALFPPGTELLRLYGSMPQADRTATSRRFRDATSPPLLVMFATDVCERGIDWPGVSLVVQYDAPTSVSDYVHRSGRTARMGQPGRVVTFLNPHEEGGANAGAPTSLSTGKRPKNSRFSKKLRCQSADSARHAAVTRAALRDEVEASESESEVLSDSEPDSDAVDVSDFESDSEASNAFGSSIDDSDVDEEAVDVTNIVSHSASDVSGGQSAAAGDDLAAPCTFSAVLQRHRIRAVTLSLESLLRALRALPGLSGNTSHRAAQVQGVIEAAVEASSQLSELACLAYKATLNAYPVRDDKELKRVFRLPKLHTGHLAKSFALRLTPEQIAQKLTKRKADLSFADDGDADTAALVARSAALALQGGRAPLTKGEVTAAREAREAAAAIAAGRKPKNTSVVKGPGSKKQRMSSKISRDQGRDNRLVGTGESKLGAPVPQPRRQPRVPIAPRDDSLAAPDTALSNTAPRLEEDSDDDDAIRALSRRMSKKVERLAKQRARLDAKKAQRRAERDRDETAMELADGAMSLFQGSRKRRNGAFEALSEFM
jgi:superfamily II DNA/RNA helicase